MLLEEEFDLTPLHFFGYEIDFHAAPAQAKQLRSDSYALPPLYELAGEEPFAAVYGAWSPDGLHFLVCSTEKIVQSRHPEVTRGDAVELMIDTRDVKTSGFNTRYCHHFFFLAQEVKGVDRGESTHFRLEDSHPHCDPSLLELTVTPTRQGYDMQIFIPRDCLHGYDGGQFKRLGFTYRINRCKGAQQQFAADSKEYQIEQQPSLWSTLKLTT